MRLLCFDWRKFIISFRYASLSTVSIYSIYFLGLFNIFSQVLVSVTRFCPVKVAIVGVMMNLSKTFLQDDGVELARNDRCLLILCDVHLTRKRLLAKQLSMFVLNYRIQTLLKIYS